MMRSTWKAACFLLIFYKISETQASLNTFLNVVEAVQNVYLTPSTYVVFDKHGLDFAREKILLEVIRSHSRRDVMSQAITFDDLERLSNRRENTLYSILINDRENLEHAIRSTASTDMSIHRWFLYIRKATKFDCDKPDEDNFFKLKMNSWMSVMCARDTILKSFHRITENQTEVVDLAVWSQDNMRLEFKNKRRLIESQLDLKGITLRVAAKMSRNETNDINANIATFNYELLDELAYSTNFKTKVVAIERELGYLNPNTNKWYGMIKVLDDKVADIGVALVTMSYTRMKVVDYAIPLAKGPCNLYVKLPDEAKVLWTTYFMVFNRDAWAVIGMSILMLSLLVYLLKNGYRRLPIQSFFEDFLRIWGMFSMQGFNDTSPSIYIKIIYVSILLTSLILNAIYSASITSYIAMLSPELPFSSYSEFLRDDSHDLSVVKGGWEHGVILSNQSHWAPLQRRLKKANLLPDNSHEGFRQACRDKTAFFTDEVTYNNQNYLPCKLGVVSLKHVSYKSFVLTKNSSYMDAINYNILRLMDYGILNRLRHKYFEKHVELDSVQPNVIKLTEIWSIIIIWAIGLVIAVTGLLVEIIVFRCPLRISSTKRTRNTLLRDNSCRLTTVMTKRDWSEQKMAKKQDGVLLVCALSH